MLMHAQQKLVTEAALHHQQWYSVINTVLLDETLSFNVVMKIHS